MDIDLQTEPSNILIVDDDKAVLFTYDLVLSGAGYKVFNASNSMEALELLGSKDINVIFIDLNLPDAKGIELCKQIRFFQPNAYIFAITGSSKHFDITACYQTGFDDYLEKPISLDLLRTSALKAFDQIKGICNHG